MTLRRWLAPSGVALLVLAALSGPAVADDEDDDLDAHDDEKGREREEKAREKEEKRERKKGKHGKAAAEIREPAGTSKPPKAPDANTESLSGDVLRAIEKAESGVVEQANRLLRFASSPWATPDEPAPSDARSRDPGLDVDVPPSVGWRLPDLPGVPPVAGLIAALVVITGAAGFGIDRLAKRLMRGVR